MLTLTSTTVGSAGQGTVMSVAGQIRPLRPSTATATVENDPRWVAGPAEPGRPTAPTPLRRTQYARDPHASAARVRTSVEGDEL
jgi:hypothetical protein